MTYLVDTAAISELKRTKPNPKVVSWFEKVAPDSLYMSVLTIGELTKGIERLPKSKKRSELALWIEKDLPNFFEADRILPISLSVARRWGSMFAELQTKGYNPPIIDSLISATCLEHDLICVTMNIDDIQRCGAKVLHPGI